MLIGLVDVIVLTSAQVRDGREKLLCSDESRPSIGVYVRFAW